MTTLTELAALLDAATGPIMDNRALTILWETVVGRRREDWDDTWADTLVSRALAEGSIDAALALMERRLPWIKYYILRRRADGDTTEYEFVIEHCFVPDATAPCGVISMEPVIAPTAPLAILKALVAALVAQEKYDGQA